MITPKFRASFPNIDRPKMNDQGVEKYSVTMMFDKNKADLSEFKKNIKSQIEAKWGKDSSKWPTFKKTIKDGDDPERGGQWPEMRGHWIIEARTNRKPGMVDSQNKEIIGTGKFYAGCFCRAEGNLYTYDRNGNRGVAFGLNNIQFWEDGEPLGGSSKPANEVFSPLVSDSDELPF